MGREIRPGELVVCSPRIRRLTQNNPGPFTGPGTNTHLVGAEALFLVDPGQEDDAHFARLVQAVGEARVLAVLTPPPPPDHWPLARRLAERFGAPVLAFAERAGLRPDRLLADGEVLLGPDVTLEVLHTPGHASDHLCFRLVEEQALFSGDLVMGWSTTVISPPDGNLNDYMASLERLRHLDMERMYPAHGPPVTEPHARVDELVRHRRARTEQLLAALAGGPAPLPALVEQVYGELDPRLRDAAGRSLTAHLEALLGEGWVRSETRPDGDEWFRLA
jgi:glyoxylase-like metal-dependent hydrolase (beta-lactamase superfamily II)